MAWAKRGVVNRLSVPVYPQHLSPAARHAPAGEGKENEDGSMALGGMRVWGNLVSARKGLGQAVPNSGSCPMQNAPHLLHGSTELQAL